MEARIELNSAQHGRPSTLGLVVAGICETRVRVDLRLKSLRTRREPATIPAWVISWEIEMAKTENRKIASPMAPAMHGMPPWMMRLSLTRSTISYGH